MQHFGMAAGGQDEDDGVAWLDRRFSGQYRSDLVAKAAMSLCASVLLIVREGSAPGPWRIPLAAGWLGFGALELAVALRRPDDAHELPGDVASWHKNGNRWLAAVILAATVALLVVDVAR
jgi:hypothetical protein